MFESVGGGRGGPLRILGFALGLGWLAGLAMPWAISASWPGESSPQEWPVLAGLALAAANALVVAFALTLSFSSRRDAIPADKPNDDKIAALTASSRNWHDRSLMFSEREFERKKYAEMWFDIYRYELELLLVGDDDPDARAQVIKGMARDKQEWFRRKFFEYVENAKAKITRKGFLYTAILDDLQELRFELSSMAEIIERSGVSGYDAPTIREAEIAVDRFIYQVANGIGVTEIELGALIEDIGDLLKSQRKDWDDLGFRQITHESIAEARTVVENIRSEAVAEPGLNGFRERFGPGSHIELDEPIE